MRAALPLVVLLAVLAGCTGGGAEVAADETPPSTEAPPAGNAPAAPADEPAAPTLTTVAVSWDGRLETGARVCDTSAPSCHEARPTEDDEETRLERLRGRVAGGVVNFTWTPQSPLTEELRGVVVVERTCEGCARVVLALGVGPSPLSLELAPMEVPLAPEDVVRVYARAPHQQQQDPLYVQADGAQAFHVEGILVLEEPAGDAT